MIPPVAVYVSVDASAADGAASMDANAISPTESVWDEMRIMIVALGMRRRAITEYSFCFCIRPKPCQTNGHTPFKRP